MDGRIPCVISPVRFFLKRREWGEGYVNETRDVGVHHDFDVVFGDVPNFIHSLD
jgi:hypothetical protein